MPNDKTTNYEFDLINDSDSVKAGVKTKPNANWNALDELLHDDFATKAEVDVSQEAQDAKIARAWKDSVNLHPFLIAGYDGYFNRDKIGINVDAIVSTSDDGWSHVERGNENIASYPVPRFFFDPEPGATYTLLFEVANFTPADSTSKVSLVNPSSENAHITPNSFVNLSIMEDSVYRIPFHTGTGTTLNRTWPMVIVVSKNTSCDIRLSLYEGTYTGPYVPYDFDQPSNIKKRLASVEDASALAWKDSAGQINLAPFFSEKNRFNTTFDATGLQTWSSMLSSDAMYSGITFLDDGWVHYDSSTDLGNNSVFWFAPIRELDTSKSYTLLEEFRNIEIGTNGSALVGLSRINATAAQVTQLTLNGGSGASSRETLEINSTDISERRQTLKTPSEYLGPAANLLKYTITNSGVTDISFDIRLSLYEGNYSGSYIPYNFSSPQASRNRMEISRMEEYDTRLVIERLSDAIGVCEFFPNGGTFGSSSGYMHVLPAMKTDLTAHKSVIAPANPYIPPSGMQFSGWNTTPEGTGTFYNVGDIITVGRTYQALYAQWEPAS